MLSSTVRIIVAVAALLAPTAIVHAEQGIIYAQSQHQFNPNYWWVFATYDTFNSQIVAQSFSTWRAGTVTEIALGGGFEFFEGQSKPDNLVVELWEPIAPSRWPRILLAQWIVPTDQLVEDTDPEGFPLLVIDVRAAALELERGRDYCVAAYGDGDSAEAFDWTIDMANGHGSFWMSRDNANSWSGRWWFGDPSEGNPTANFEYEIRGDVEPDPSVICDQTAGHVMTGGAWWTFPCYGSTQGDSDIIAQSFSPSYPGAVGTVAVGGCADVGAEPENLILEIWQPIAPGRQPNLLLAQWIAPWGSLSDEFDAEGLPLKVADVSYDPVELTYGSSYDFVVYGDSGRSNPWRWTHDMTGSETFTFWRSYDNEGSWSGDWSFGPPEEGNPATAFEFALYEETGTVEWFQTPDVGVWGRYDPANSGYPFFNPGWNWWSPPYPPVYDHDPASFIGFTYEILRNNLYRWENLNTELYPDDFNCVQGRRGYLLRLDAPLSEVSYQGRRPSSGYMEIRLAGGWNWFGIPEEMTQTDMLVRNDQTGEERTVVEDEAMGLDAWLKYNWAFYDSAARTVRLAYHGGGVDDTILHPWFGYRVFLPRPEPGETYTLLVPVGGE